MKLQEILIHNNLKEYYKSELLKQMQEKKQKTLDEKEDAKNFVNNCYHSELQKDRELKDYISGKTKNQKEKFIKENNQLIDLKKKHLEIVKKLEINKRENYIEKEIYEIKQKAKIFKLAMQENLSKQIGTKPKK